LTAERTTYINRRGLKTVQETTGISRDANSRDARTVETTLKEGMFHSRDAINTRDSNNSRDTRNVGGNNCSRKNINSSGHGGNSRDFSPSRISWDVDSSKNNNSSRHVSNSRDHYNN
jgi:hypothetical protein